MHGEGLIVLLVLAILGTPIGVGIWLIAQTNAARRRLDELSRRIGRVELDLHQITEGRGQPPSGPAKPELAPVPVVPLPTTLLERREAPRPVTPPPLAPVVAQVTTPPQPPPLAEPPLVAKAPPPLPPPPARPTLPAINWENFLGVKLFAWIGALLLFLAVAFFIKYSFEHNLIPPALRIALGYIIAVGLLVWGLRMPREKYAVLVQTFCAAAVLILYGTTFAAHGMYHLIPVLPTFALMTLVTAVAFVLAARLEAQVVVILGLLGGFLTPVLLSTGEDRPLGLFSYIALLDIGLIAVALRQRWNHLVPLTWLGTAIMQFGWADKFFEVTKINTALTVFLAFAALFVAALAVVQRLSRSEKWTQVSAILAPAAALVFGFYLLVHPYPDIAARPGLLFGYIFAADLALLAIAWLETRLRPVHLGAGAAAFLLLAIWTGKFLTDDLLNWALGLYFVFAVLHAVYPVVLGRLRPSRFPLWWARLFPVVALALVLLPITRLDSAPLIVWPVVLLVDLLAIGLAVVTSSLVAVVAVLLLTVGIVACWLTKIPAELTGLPQSLFVIGGFAIFFFIASLYAGRKVLAKLAAAPKAEKAPDSDAFGPAKILGESPMAQLPAASAILPFLLLIMLTVRLPLENPSPVFGLAALLVVLLLGVVRTYGFDALGGVGLVATFLLERVWHAQHFTPDRAALALGWHLGFAAVFFAFPFVFRERFRDRTIPWAVSALALPLHFLLIYDTVKDGWPNDYLGLVPATLAVPLLAALMFLLRTLPADAPKRTTQLALFGGAALFFITLIFP
ncbi:MAG TPA: DUF2339 domain-containing protein, partial [Verrucomicrobiae bacterium]